MRSLLYLHLYLYLHIYQTTTSAFFFFGIVSRQPSIRLQKGGGAGTLSLKSSVEEDELSDKNNYINENLVEAVVRDNKELLFQSEATKFKVMVCGSTSCSKQRRIMQMDEYATFGGLYSRAQSANVEVEVEESGCVGSCKKAPVVAVTHEDFMGYVGLNGMRPAEFADNRFHKVATEEDLDRVWDCVENAVHEMVLDAADADCDNDDEEEKEED